MKNSLVLHLDNQTKRLKLFYAKHYFNLQKMEYFVTVAIIYTKLAMIDLLNSTHFAEVVVPSDLNGQSIEFYKSFGRFLLFNAEKWTTSKLSYRMRM